MIWTIEFTSSAKREFAKLDRATAKRIHKYVPETLSNAEDPRQWGKPLKGKLAEYWSYRVGDFRLLCTIENRELTILVVRIGNRREIYR